MTEKKQVMRFSDAELQIIKNSFADNEILLKCIRKVFLQVPLTDDEKNIIVSAFKDKPDLEKVIRKTFLPQIDAEAPIYQVIDLWMTVEIKDKDPQLAYSHLQSRDILIKYLAQQLDVLFGAATEKGIDFARLSDISQDSYAEVYAQMLARNTLISHVEQQLGQLSLLAGQNDETVEQTKTRLAQDSSK